LNCFLKALKIFIKKTLKKYNELSLKGEKEEFIKVHSSQLALYMSLCAMYEILCQKKAKIFKESMEWYQYFIIKQITLREN
jgi:hypothetical protein